MPGIFDRGCNGAGSTVVPGEDREDVRSLSSKGQSEKYFLAGQVPLRRKGRIIPWVEQEIHSLVHAK